MTVTPLPPRPPGTLKERVAEEVRAQLARRNISVNSAAKELGWSQPYLSRRVNGKVAFDVEDLDTLAIWLGIPVGVLLGQTADATPGPPRGRTGTDTGAHTDWYRFPYSPRPRREAQIIEFPGRYHLVSASG